MIRIPDIQNGVEHLVGWENDGTLTAGMEASESGLTYQQAHPLLTLDNIRAVMPQDYAGGLEAYLARAVRNGAAAMVNRYIETKSLNRTTKMLLEHRTVLAGAGRLTNRTVPSHSIVGYEIETMRGVGVTVQLHAVGLQMYGGTGNVTLYLFHSSRREPVRTLTIDLVSASGFQWTRYNDIYLPYMGGDTDAGGVWWLCYNEDALPEGVESINIGRDFSKDPCGPCGGGSRDAWRMLTRYVRVSPFRAVTPDDFDSNPRLFDTGDIDYTPTESYGMNLELSVGCDVTDFIIAQRSLFASVLQKQVAYDLLREIAYNPRTVVNRNQSNVQRQEFLFELDGNTMTRSSGLRGELEKAYKAIEVNTQGISEVCLPCKRRGVTYGGV